MEIGGVILAGGRASRMGGGDKGLLPLGGRPMLGHVLARLAPQVGPLAISANGDPARLAGFGLPVLADSLPDHPGPLAGVLAGLDWAAGLGLTHVLSAAADTPFLPPDLCARLAGAGGPTIAASRDAGGVLRLHGTFGLWPVAARAELRAGLEAGLRRVARWAEAQGARVVEFPTGAQDPFFNVNTPGDLARAEALLRGGGQPPEEIAGRGAFPG